MAGSRVRASAARGREFGSSVATIVTKELRSRIRGRRAFVVLTIYLGVLALIAYGTYIVTAPRALDNFGEGGGLAAANASARIGQAIFTSLSLYQLLLVCFITPAFTAGTISLEREKQTLDLLISTPLRPGAIVAGKLLAALAFVFLMILAAIPLSALVLMYGGAGADDIVRQQIVLLVTALGLGTIGVFWSALTKRTQAATVLTYCTVLALTIGSVLLFIFWSALVSGSGVREAGRAPTMRAPEQIVWANPLVAMSDVIASTEPGGYGDFNRVISELRGQPSGFGSNDVAAPDACPPGARCAVEPAVPVNPARLLVGHFWPPFTITFAFLSVLLTAVSMHLVVPAGMRFVFTGRRRRTDEAAVIAVPGEGEATIEPIGDPK